MNKQYYHPLCVNQLHDGTQVMYRFINNYGASVVYHKHSNGIELAVIKFTDNEYEIVYDTYITDDIISYLNIPEVYKILSLISDLK